MSRKTIRPFHIFKKLCVMKRFLKVMDCKQQLQVREKVVGFEKALGAVKVIKDQNSIQVSELAQLCPWQLWVTINGPTNVTAVELFFFVCNEVIKNLNYQLFGTTLKGG